MLAYYVKWHMPAALAPMLFDDKAKVSVVRASCDKITQAAPVEQQAFDLLGLQL